MGAGVKLVGIGQITKTSFKDNAAAKATLGIGVDRATAALPETTTEAIFTVAGGRCMITQILGEVTTVIQTQACNLKIAANPTATGSSVDLCADLNVSAKVLASLFGITGTAADALVNGMSILAQVTPVIVQAGTIDLVTDATNTGSVKWHVRYIPLDEGASIVAA